MKLIWIELHHVVSIQNQTVQSQELLIDILKQKVPLIQTGKEQLLLLIIFMN